jgi:branched-chain amino acid aminotransferase
MKAYKDSEGKIRLFRPECNAQRFKKSSERIALPDFDGNEMIKCIEEYVRLESRWIPSIREFSLYLRPLHMAMENSLGVKHPNKSLMMIMASPAGPYYPTGFKPISLSCGVGTIRSAPGGMGMFKVGGNYGPTLGTTQEANKKGHQQVLWLFNDTKIIEVGASNIFFVFKSKTGKKAEIVTPAI